MKRILILVSILFTLSGLNNVIQAQCKPCPELFQLTDSGCTRINIFGQSSNPGQQTVYFVSDSIRACAGSKVNYNITANIAPCSYPGITYTYVISNGFLVSSSGGNFQVQWGAGGTGSITVNFSMGGAGGDHCSGSFTIYAVLYPNPVAAFTIAPNPACLNNQPICFNAITSIGAVNYFWDFGDGNQGTGLTACHTYAGPGTYTVTLIVTGGPLGGAGGGTSPNPTQCKECVDSVKHTVLIYNLPGPPIDSCHGTVCAGEESTYCTPVAPGCGTFVWTVVGGVITGGTGVISGGGTILTGTSATCVTVQWGSGNPQGSITLQILGCPSYCSQGTTVAVPIIPAVTTISGSAVACVGTSATYSLPAWPGTSYFWSINGGGTIIGNNTNTNQIVVNWTTVGTWTITCNYYDSAKHCGGVGTLVVNVRPIATITGVNKFCAGSSTTLSTPGFSSTWSITPAGASISGGGVVTSSTPGTYTVTATPTSPLACNTPTYTVTVLAKPILNPITGRDSICKGQTFTYAVTSNQVGTFTWVATNASSVVNVGTFNDSVQVTWNNSGGPYTLSVTQVSSTTGCVSNPVTFTAYAFPPLIISGPLNVCADAIGFYTITNIGNHAINWFVIPGNLGTVISGQGTSTVQIKWHGSNSPGSSNTVHLHAGFCGDDSIAIVITEPVLPVITATGTLCGSGVNLSVAATGSFSWSCTEHAISPVQPTNLSSLTGLNLPGHYTVTITNYNGTGCTVSNTYFIPDVGRPIASISASNVLNYCLPATPNMNLVAAYALGYNYQWYGPGGAFGPNSSTVPINSTLFPIFNTPGSYNFYVVVTLGGCVVTSNVLTITTSNCVGNPYPLCTGAIAITGITGCNPFTVSLTATAPVGGTIVGGTTTISYTSPVFPSTSGNTSMTFDSVGYKQITVCADIALPGGGTTRCCKDTVVLVTVASKFLANINCGVVTLTDLSTVVFPATISSYAWSVGNFPGNTPVLPIIASFNNPALASPILTFTQSGTYIVTQQIVSGGCTVLSRDTLVISVPNATFSANNSCVGTPINLSAPGGFTSYYWDFGDAATSYTQNTSHSYAVPGTFTITLTVTDANGCTATNSQTVTIIAKPTCVLTVLGPTTFCFGDSVVLKSCNGLTGYQWYNNGTLIPLATNITYAATQTGNYYCVASNINGCTVSSDTVSVLVNAAPPANVTTSGSVCLGGTFTFGVPACGTCSYSWTDNGNPIPLFTNSQSGIVGPGMIGTHTFAVVVTNTSTGCTATGSATVTFYNLPTVSISVAPVVGLMCSNNNYTLTATSSASSPAWAWTYNFINFVISTNNVITASAAGTYVVTVTDGITGCSASTNQVILPSPDLGLFPTGCDTLCDTSHVFLPLGSIGGNLSGYTITWYDNAPPYTTIIGTGPSLPLGPPLALGNHNISVIVISPNGCADTSNNYHIFVKHCADCSCDQSHWGEQTWEQDTVHVTNPIENVIIPHVLHSFKCGDNLGNIGCNSPILIKANFYCVPASCNQTVTYTLTGPVTQTGSLPFSTMGLPTGNYVLTMIGKCGDSICKVCDLSFHINCDTVTDCCQGSYFNDIIISESVIDDPAGGEVFIDTIHCGANIPDTLFIDPAHNNCNKFIIIKAGFTSPDSCDLRFVFELSFGGAVIDSGVLLYPTGGYAQMNITWLPNLTFAANGIYTLCFKAYIGGVLCKVCCFTIVKNCPTDCCEGSHWILEPSYAQFAPGFNIGGGIGEQPVLTPINCGVPGTVIYINNSLNNCNQAFGFNATISCPDTCNSNVIIEVLDSTNTVLYSGPGPLTVLFNLLPNGTYTVKFKGYCGGVLCKVCSVTVIKNCEDCCANSHWASGPTWSYPLGELINGNVNTHSEVIPCGQHADFAINNVIGNCNVPITVSGTWVCGSTVCAASVEYKLYNAITNTLVSTSTGSLVIPTSLPNGSYCVTIYAYCGTQICDSCKFCFVKNCGSCCDQSHWKSADYTHMWQTGTAPDDGFMNTFLKLDCSPYIPDTVYINNALQNCNVYFDIAADFVCPPGCQSHATIVITDSAGNVIVNAHDSIYGNNNGGITYIWGGPSLPNGTYTLTYNGYCGGVLCKTCKITFIRNCDDCCTNSHWAEGPYWNNNPNNPSGNLPIVCGESNFIISDATGNCNNPVVISGAYVCGSTTCSGSVKIFVYNSVTNALVFSSTTGSLTILPDSLANGSYCVKMYGYCGNKICDSCTFCFTKLCDECCTNSHWEEGPTWLSTALQGGLGVSTATPIICGQSQFAINNVIGNCNTPTTVTGTYICGPGCTSNVVFKLYNTVGNVLITTSTGSLTIPTGLANGSYSVTIYAYCGNKICDSCKFTFIKNCIDCCKGSKWSSGPWWVNGNTGVKTLIKCNTSRFTINNTSKLCFVPFKVNGTYLCGGTACGSLVTYELKDSATGAIVSTSNDSLIVPVGLANGVYIVTIKAYCGGVLCNTCTFKIDKLCSCDCGPQTGAISVTLTTNQLIKSYKCGAVLPIIDCKDTVTMNGSYACNQSGCPAAYSYVLNGPFGTTSGTLPLTLSGLTPGSYSIMINAYCNGILCKECNYNFTVKCDSVPPPPCCPYEIGVVANAPLYALVYQSANPDGTIIRSTGFVSENFSFTGIVGVPVTEIRAEVISYTLSSNYMNECMSCKNYPVNWGSVASGSAISGITPKITLFGGATTTSFSAGASSTYQNPREIIWNNGSPFNVPDSLAIGFYIPGPSPIDCCVLNGQICVKFTFRDIKCRECEAIVCFPFRATMENGGVIYSRH